MRDIGVIEVDPVLGKVVQQIDQLIFGVRLGNILVHTNFFRLFFVFKRRA